MDKVNDIYGTNDLLPGMQKEVRIKNLLANEAQVYPRGYRSTISNILTFSAPDFSRLNKG
jgi:hypothetical protein